MIIQAIIRIMKYPGTGRLAFVPKQLQTLREGNRVQPPCIKHLELSALSWQAMQAGLSEYNVDGSSRVNCSTVDSWQQSEGHQDFFGIEEVDQSATFDTPDQVYARKRTKITKEGDPLTPQEGRVLGHLCKLRQVKDFAREMYICEDTARRHIQSILKKLGVHSIKEAIEKVSACV